MKCISGKIEEIYRKKCQKWHKFVIAFGSLTQSHGIP